MVLPPGTTIAGYRVEKKLGAGGMGTVYRAAHRSLPRHDALKILSAELSHDDQFRARFIREADLAATLDHPNIVTVYDRGESDGQLWIAMQYIDGTDADHEVLGGNITPARAVHILTEVAAALDYAHGRGVVHRDVKPANFLIAAESGRVFLADFGIARAANEAIGITQAGTVMASVAYAAPETLAGDPRAVGPRADIYSLGCSAFRLLTGQVPFSDTATGGGVAGVMAAHLLQAPPRITDRAPHLPEALNAVFARVMAKNPEDRYGSAGEFAAAVSAAAAETSGPPVPAQEAPSPSGPGEASLYPKRLFSGQKSNAGAARALVVGAGGRRRRWLRPVLLLAVVAVLATAGAGVWWWTGRTPAVVYGTQTFDTTHGSITLTSAPSTVAVVGPGDADAAVALGVQPAVVVAAGGRLPGWLHATDSGGTNVVGYLDTAAVASAHPDVIIASGPVDDATYTKLTAIAPTITQPKALSDKEWTWTEQLKWVGRVLGKQSSADELIALADSRQADLRNANTEAFKNKSVTAITLTDFGIGQVLTPSNTADYFTALGFVYDQDLKRGPYDTSGVRPLANTEKLYLIESDVLVVVRSDKSAGGGGFSGLPKQLAAYHGTIVVADDPDVVAALDDPGGFLATQFLNEHLAPQLAAALQ
ncbi:serine/threonine-protein kinase [Mycolicibacterium mageritense]|uniref:serine/threonine-protein kinase n=1 Tax=Mycolicibacterium mageritense TaxID=53462 RepID=UPI0011D88896|nr:serine/threonine-protein kinase [Mycolicibacterium mageritense]TXI51954.1 MAG: serine/threonine protein kinase [Mycolicibacterium mageritense]